MSNGVTGTAQDLYLFLRICFHDMVNPPETQVKIRGSGAVDERFKSHAWKACVG
jgi:hypothetical protein